MMRKYYKTCDTLPLKNFFKVMEMSDYKYLIITDDYEGVECKKDLSELWETILHEYSELEGNGKILEKFDAFKELHQLAATFDIINAMIYSLYYRYNKQYIDELAMFGYKIEIIDNCITEKSLQTCSQMARSILNDIDEVKRTINPDEEPKNTKNLFYKAIAWLIKGYGNLEDNITVAKYVALKNHLNKIIKDENGRNKRK